MEWTNGPWQRVADGCWVARCEPARVNVGLVAGATGCALIDTGTTRAQGEALAASIASVTDRPLVAAVITHAHWDHWYGLGGLGDVRSVGHASLAPTDEAPLPTQRISLTAVVDLGGRILEVVHPGHAHTPGDLIVTVPDAQVLFTGDLVELGDPPYAGPESSVEGWQAALELVTQLVRPGWAVVPGHGDVTDADEVVRQLSDVRRVRKEAERLARAGVSEANAVVEGNWPWPDAAAQGWVADAYRELAARGIVPGRTLDLKQRPSS